MAKTTLNIKVSDPVFNTRQTDAGNDNTPSAWKTMAKTEKIYDQSVKKKVCLPHGLMLTKLKCYGLTDQARLLLKPNISDRKQRVKIGISRSAWGLVDYGVPF